MTKAAEAALAAKKYVSAIDVFCGMGVLTRAHVDDWRKGRIDFLERVIRGNLRRISLSMKMFRCWAREKGLKPSDTAYVRRTRGGKIELRFSKFRHPNIEKSYCTHWLSPALAERKKAAGKRDRRQRRTDVSLPRVPFEELLDYEIHDLLQACGDEPLDGGGGAMDWDDDDAPF